MPFFAAMLMLSPFRCHLYAIITSMADAATLDATLRDAACSMRLLAMPASLLIRYAATLRFRTRARFDDAMMLIFAAFSHTP